MTITILMPHYKNGKATAYCIAQLLKYKGGHEIEIVVIDNSNCEGIEYLEPFRYRYHLINTKPDSLQSHGIAYDIAMQFTRTEYFITLESDSFPTQDDWLGYYEQLINDGYECAGSHLWLSGGNYLHPAGALYKTSNWHECKEYCDNIKYKYFPNMNLREGFDAHLMIREDICDKVLENPEDYFDLAKGYKPYSKEKALEKMEYYKPSTGVFHNGMGNLHESIRTYGKRNIQQDSSAILIDNKKPMIARIGYEPGQFFAYWHYAMNKSVGLVPTEIKWLPNRENQQQEYTKMENGFTHVWAGSSFLDMKGTEMNDVYEFKKNQIDELYNSLPEKYKI